MLPSMNVDSEAASVLLMRLCIVDCNVGCESDGSKSSEEQPGVCYNSFGHS